MQESCVARRQSSIETKFKEEGKIGGKRREEGDLPSCTSPPPPGPLIKTLSMASSVSVLAGLTQWRIQAIKAAPPPLLSQGLDDRAPHPLSEDLDPLLWLH